ncbi:MULTISPECIES: hypothetical protein [Burkholderia]|uniref:hypothetical protein n=1 Tax=Burkholderia TaxID=32008 RepID=UPI0012D8C9EB|nr:MULTISPECIES: hypothetical protein [Burkholderia]
MIAEQVVAESANPGTVARSAGIDANETIGLCNSTISNESFQTAFDESFMAIGKK